MIIVSTALRYTAECARVAPMLGDISRQLQNLLHRLTQWLTHFFTALNLGYGTIVLSYCTAITMSNSIAVLKVWVVVLGANIFNRWPRLLWHQKMPRGVRRSLLIPIMR